MQTSQLERPVATRRGEAAFTLIEIMVAMTFLATSLMAFVGAVVSSQVLARQTREMHLANATMMTAVEDFRYQSSQAFDSTVGSYKSVLGLSSKSSSMLPQPQGLGDDADLTARVILDETQMDPPVDLNGDGDFLDKNLQPQDVNAVVLKVTLKWGLGKRAKKIDYMAIVARRQVK